MKVNALVKPTSRIERIEHCGMHVDLVRTSKGFIRVGSMPDISKMLDAHGFKDEMVIVPPWEGSMAGDNQTGEEFILWQAQVKDGFKRKYVGLDSNLNLLSEHLKDTFSFYFDTDLVNIINKKWLKRWFESHSVSSSYKDDSLKINFEENNIIIEEQGSVIYDRNDLKKSCSPDILITDTLESLSRDSKFRQSLEITPIGTGNGFFGIVSSCIVRCAEHVIWIDPAGYPAHTLGQKKIHWDDITHILITHNHEDHIQGFSACLKRAEKNEQPIQLITAPSIHDQLKKHFTPFCSDFTGLVRLIPLEPEKPIILDPLTIKCRWNHHILPYGTLGLKFKLGDKGFGYSGDTKYDEKINMILKREELLPDWFADCDLIFHEVNFDDPNSVHTHWKSLEQLGNEIPGKVLGYHTFYHPDAPLQLAEEGKVYQL